MFRLMKFKPPYGWNAVTWELAIVTLGVLIALGAQQVVEGWSWDRKVAAAEQTMRDEIKNSLLAVVELQRLEKCTTAQIRALEDAIRRGDEAKAGSILQSGIGVGRLWADNAFEATLAAQVSDHLGAEKVKQYSQVYQMIRDNRRLKEASQEASPYLSALYLGMRLPDSQELRSAQLREVASWRVQIEGMRERGKVLVRYAKKDLGLEGTQGEYLRAPGRADTLEKCEANASDVKGYGIDGNEAHKPR